MTVAEQILTETKSLEERGIPADSFFQVFFTDGSSISEKNANWSAMSEDMRAVNYFGNKKSVRVLKFPASKISMHHEDLYAEIEIPEGCQVFQAIRAETMFLPNGTSKPRTIGRVIGLVRDGEVIEEQFLNGLQHEVLGVRK